MKKRELAIENTADGYWLFQDRYVGPIAEAPLHQLLAWILQQLNFGHYRVEDELGRDIGYNNPGVTLILGREVPFPGITEEAALEAGWRRILAVWAAEDYTKARESGYASEHRDTVEGWVLGAGTQGDDARNARLNTEFHFAFRFLEQLGKIARKSLDLSALALENRASPTTLWYLREASRCHTFGLRAAAIALCRACLEQALTEAVSPEELEAEREVASKAGAGADGRLALLIRAALRTGRLDRSLASMAHDVRQRGNDIMHGETLDAQPAEVLTSTKRILEGLFGF